MPLALGWDSSNHSLHPYAGIWALGEVFIIGTVSTIYWRGHRRHWQEQVARRPHHRRALLVSAACSRRSLDLDAPAGEAELWYLRVFDPGQHLQRRRRCRDPLQGARAAGAAAARRARGTIRAFVSSYAAWAIGHFRPAAQLPCADRERASTRSSTACTASTSRCSASPPSARRAGAPRSVHTLWLSLVTTVFPALGASLLRRAGPVGGLSAGDHLGAAGARAARRSIERIRTALTEASRAGLGDVDSDQGRGRSRHRIDPRRAPGLAPARPPAHPAARVGRIGRQTDPRGCCVAWSGTLADRPAYRPTRSACRTRSRPRSPGRCCASFLNLAGVALGCSRPSS